MYQSKSVSASVFSVLGVMATGLAASPVSLVLDPAQSSVDMSITIDVGVANSTDMDSSPLSGSMEIDLDGAAPTEISILDYMVIIQNAMNFNWSFGFFGSADASLTNGSVAYANPGSPLGPVPIVDDSFSLLSAPTDLAGLLEVNYNILLVGSGSETVNLGDQGTFDSELNGVITVDGSTVTLTATLPLNTTQPLTDANGNELGTATTVGTATIVAIGTITPCVADFTNDGDLNFFDVSAFLNAFNTQDPSADLTNDGLYNFFDISAFLAAFSAGCP